MHHTPDSTQTQLAAACILLSVADVDEILEDQELDTIKAILKDFFTIDEKSVELNSYVEMVFSKVIIALISTLRGTENWEKVQLEIES